MGKAKVQGGRRLARFLRNTERARRIRPAVHVGFKGRQIAVLAGRLEFGDPDSNLPERPAFAMGIQRLPDVAKEWRKTYLRGRDWREGIVLPDEAWRALAIAARDAIRESYLSFHGPGLSERQAERKAGTEGADRELVGSEGPKLIGHIRAYVNGVEVG